MNKCFFIQEGIPLILIIILLFLESLVKKNIGLSDDFYLFFLVIPTVALYPFIIKIFKTKITC